MKCAAEEKSLQNNKKLSKKGFNLKRRTRNINITEVKLNKSERIWSGNWQYKAIDIDFKINTTLTNPTT